MAELVDLIWQDPGPRKEIALKREELLQTFQVFR